MKNPQRRSFLRVSVASVVACFAVSGRAAAGLFHRRAVPTDCPPAPPVLAHVGMHRIFALGGPGGHYPICRDGWNLESVVFKSNGTTLTEIPRDGVTPVDVAITGSNWVSTDMAKYQLKSVVDGLADGLWDCPQEAISFSGGVMTFRTTVVPGSGGGTSGSLVLTILYRDNGCLQTLPGATVAYAPI